VYLYNKFTFNVPSFSTNIFNTRISQPSMLLDSIRKNQKIYKTDPLAYSVQYTMIHWCF
jgi:hypothetical protein